MRGPSRRVALIAVSLALCAGVPSAARGGAQFVSAGFTCETYATVPGPVSLSFDGAGNLFAGRDVPGSTGGDTVKIHRISPGGSPVVEYGESAIPDPDGVLVDGDGSISGTPGAVIVCGQTPSGEGQIVAVLPDESIATLQTPTAALLNPNYMARGRDGLLVSDSGNNTVFEFNSPGPPAVLINSPSAPYNMLVDANGRIFIAHADGVIRIYDADGALVDGAFATGLGSGPSIAFGKGGAFGTDLYAANPSTGDLVRIAPDRTATTVGTGLPSSLGTMTFGPDGALYICSYQAGEVLRITPKVVETDSFFLPRKIAVKTNADPARTTFVAQGFLDTGSKATDLTAAAQLTIGSLVTDIPSLTASPDGKVFTHSAPGLFFQIVKNPFGSSRAKFKLKRTGDLGGAVPSDGEVDFRFSNAVVDARCRVALTAGQFRIGKKRGALVAPNLFVVRSRASVPGGGKDKLTVIVGLATGGTTPSEASDVRIAYGPALDVTVPAAFFVRKGDSYVFTGNLNGITKVTLDYLRETITVSGKDLDLGAFAQGTNPLTILVGLLADSRAVSVQVARKGNTVKY